MIFETFRQAIQNVWSNKLRTFLTMLGIIIGIASVVSVVALGEGSRRKILADISGMGTNTIDIYPGKGFGDRKSSAIHTLNDRDAAALAEQGFVDSVTPGVSTSATLRVGNTALTGQVRGVGQQYFQVKGVQLAEGQAFNTEAVARYAQEMVIDPNTRQKLFGSGNALGEVILVNNLPVRVIGVTEEQKSVFGNSETLNLWIPYTTAMGRLLDRKSVV